MVKSYSDYIDEISADVLYDKLLSFGMFSDKLPPIFSSIQFAEFCKAGKSFDKRPFDYVRFDSMRNTNCPRQFGIPVPMAYENMCSVLKKHWSDIQKHFGEKTEGQSHEISRIHIQLGKNDDGLFRMNYNGSDNSDSVMDNLRIGKRFVVKADISNCFHSIYSHSIPWAAVGKSKAKYNKKRDENKWFNEIDEACRLMKSSETHGLPIGPLSSNILSEVILCTIDSELSKTWEYVRFIDDYVCFVESPEDANRFIVALASELARFDLSLNHKKTSIEKLPIESMAKWKRELGGFDFSSSTGKIGYRRVCAFFDLAIELMKANGENTAVLNYAIKMLEGKKLTDSAKVFCSRMSVHLCLLYPYLIPLMDRYVFECFEVPIHEIGSFANKAYSEGVSSLNYEECCYSILLSLKYGFVITELEKKKSAGKPPMDDCTYMLCEFLYYKKHRNAKGVNRLIEKAKELSSTDMDRNWFFVYEVLDIKDNPDEFSHMEKEWRILKENGVSFLKPQYLSLLQNCSALDKS